MSSPTLRAAADLGLPSSGPGRLAGWAPRLGALVVDWTVSYLAAWAVLGRGGGLRGAATLLPLALFTLGCWAGTALLAGTLGQLLAGVRVVRADPRERGRLVDPLHAALRAVLLALVVPAVITDSDRRGLHDRAAGTVVVSRR